MADGKNFFDQYDDAPAPQVLAPGNPSKVRKDRNDAAASDYDPRKAAADVRISEANARIAEANAGNVGSVVAPGNTELTGEEYLKTIPASLAGQVKALAEGRRAFPVGAALRSKDIQILVAAATQYDPTLDAANAATRVATRKDFTSGVTAKNITALNTALGHLGSLAQAADKLDNTSIPLWNRVGNFALSETGDPRVNNFNIARQAVVDEMERVFRGAGGGTQAGIDEWKKSISSAQSPEQLRASVSKAVELLDSRLNALGDQYQRGMGTSADPITFLSPHAREVYSALGPGGSGIIPPTTKAGNADYSEMSAGGVPSGATAVDPNAKFRRAFDSDASGFVNQLVRNGMPYQKALSQFRERFPHQSFAPQDYNKAVQYHKAHPDFKGSFGYGEKWVPLTDAERSDNRASQSGMGAFLGHAAKATAVGLPALLAGDQGALWNATTRDQHGTASFLGDLTGNVAGSLGTGGLLKGAGTLANKPGLRNLLGDSLYGAGFGATQNPEHPMAGAVFGAGASAAGNALGRYTLGPAARFAAETGPGQAAINGIARLVTKPGGPTTPFRPPAPLGAGSAMLASQASGLDDVGRTLTEAGDLGLPFSLADAHPKLRALGGSVARKSPNARSLAEEIFAPRQAGQAERAMGFIEQHLAPSGDLGEIQAAATARARAASADPYAKAMAHPAPEDAQLTALLNTPAGSTAARRAYDIALNGGEDVGQMSFHLDEAGNPQLTANPNWKTLHYIRQGLDSILEESRDPATGKLNLKNPSLRALNDLRGKFSGRMHALNPDFKAADSEYARFAGQGSAAGMGYKAAGPRVSKETVAGVVGGMPPEHLPFYQQGYASSLADTVENARFSTDPYRMVHGTPAQTAKMGTIFPQGAPIFGRINSLEGDMSKTFHETLGGSPTAARTEADKLFGSGNFMGDALELGVGAATGTPPLGLIRRLGGQKIGDSFRLGLGKSAQRKADEIAPILFDPDPNSARAALDRIAALKAERDAFEARFRRFGGSLGAPLGLGLIPRS